MKINGKNVIGVKALAGMLKGLNGYGLRYEVFLPEEGGKLVIHEFVDANSYCVYDSGMIWCGRYSIPHTMKELKARISDCISYYEADVALIKSYKN